MTGIEIVNAVNAVCSMADDFKEVTIRVAGVQTKIKMDEFVKLAKDNRLFDVRGEHQPLELTKHLRGRLSTSQGVLGAGAHALHAEDALGAVGAAARVVEHVDLHRTHASALPARDAFVVVARDPHQRKVAHRLEEHRDRAHVLAKRAVVVQRKREADPDGVIQHVPDDERPEHDSLDVAHVGQEQCGDKDE